MNKEEFESLLAYFAAAPVTFAGSKASRSSRGKSARRSTKDNKPLRRSKGKLSKLKDEISDETVLQELRRAKAILKKDPSLFSGDPKGLFTYEDPILANIAYVCQSYLLKPSVVKLAGEEKRAISKRNYWEWAKTGIKLWLSRNDKSYQTLMGMTPRESIKIEKDVIRIAVTGDAGFKGLAQKNVLDSIKERHRENPFDLLIHLGDVYFAGNNKEFFENLLAPLQRVGPTVLTLIGNHDLYFGGEAFLNALDVLRQPGRYFCIENPHWRVACLDTALPAETLRRNSGRLDKGQLTWLEEHLASGDGRETILMSHHYIVSGWETPSDDLKRQLASHLNKIFAWYWGHEHSCAIYDKKAAGFYGACIGNGAFLETWKTPSREPLPKWYAKGKCSCYQDSSEFWPHGYLELELQPKRIVEKYHLEGGKPHRRILKRVGAKYSGSKNP
jgi:hypothetical protein